MIEAEFRNFLEGLWQEHAPEELKGSPLILEEQQLRKLMTDDDREMIEPAYEKATEITLWERITKSNHEDVSYYKGLLKEYTRDLLMVMRQDLLMVMRQDLLMVMRQDFLEEITGKHIKNKAFEEG